MNIQILKLKWKIIKHNFTLDIFLALDQRKKKNLACMSDHIYPELQGLICIIYMEEVPRNQFGNKYLHYTVLFVWVIKSIQYFHFNIFGKVQSFVN